MNLNQVRSAESRPKLTPNPSLKRSANGRPPGPVWRYAVHFRQTGPGVLPLALRLSEGLGGSFGRDSALRTCFRFNRLPKYGIHPSLPARTICPKRCQDVWVYPKCNGFFRWKFVLSSNSAKLCDGGGSAAAMGDDSLLPVNACRGHRRPRGRKCGGNLVLAKEARSSL